MREDFRGTRVETGIPMKKLFQLVQIRDDGGVVQGGSRERNEK